MGEFEESLVGAVAVITGGASGMGKAFAERFGSAGCRLVLADIEEAALALQALGPAAVVLTGGHTDGDPVVDLVVAEGGRIHRPAVPRVARPPAHGTGCALRI